VVWCAKAPIRHDDALVQLVLRGCRLAHNTSSVHKFCTQVLYTSAVERYHVVQCTRDWAAAFVAAVAAVARTGAAGCSPQHQHLRDSAWSAFSASLSTIL